MSTVEDDIEVREGTYGEKVIAVEPGGAEFIPLNERHGRPLQLFWTWTSPNLEFATVFVGVIAITLFGLNMWEAATAIIIEKRPIRLSLIFCRVRSGVAKGPFDADRVGIHARNGTPRAVTALGLVTPRRRCRDSAVSAPPVSPTMSRPSTPQPVRLLAM